MTFDTAFDRLMGQEGGYVNNPADPGGETNWGISKRNHPTVDIKALTRDGAKALYAQEFWAPIRGSLISPAVAFQTFDFAVNSGISTAIRALQRAIGAADDGHWGPVSTAALAVMPESDAIMRLLAERLEFMTKLQNWPDAGRGWVRRVAANLRYGAEDA